MFNTPFGDDIYELATNDAFDWMLELIESDESIDNVIEKIDKLIEKAKFKSYKKKSFCRSRYEDSCMQDVWRQRI